MSAPHRTDVADWEDPRRALARHGLAPKKALSQHFLVSRRAVEAIVRALGPAPGEPVVELGPGLGTLTGALVGAGARVIAVERDRDMIAVLRSDVPAAVVVEGDAASVDPAALGVATPVALAGNLPYAITGAILRNLVRRAASISRAVVMVQKEVRDRLLAQPGTRPYGALTVFVQARFEVSAVAKVPAGAFHPPPRVESAVVKLVPRASPRAEETDAFRSVVRAAFDARRKTLERALVLAFGAARARRALAAAQIDGRRRGETLSVEELAALARAIE